MGDTLRSIADKWREAEKTMAEEGTIEVDRRWLHGYATGTVMSECAAELEALLAEYEKVDLVKKWRTKEWEEEHLSRLPMGMMFDPRLACADELQTWLAVNLERIKQEAKREFLRKLYRHGVVGAGTFGQWNHALEAQAKKGEAMSGPHNREEANKYRYNCWDGNPHGWAYDPKYCAYHVFAEPGANYQCTRKPGYGPDAIFCKQHAKIARA